MTDTKSIKRVAQRAKAQDKRDRMAAEKDAAQKKNLTATADSLQNFAAAIGIETGNLSSFSSYGFNPITRIRTLLEWIHRGSWLGGVAVDLVADDMTRAGVDIKGEMEPEDIQKIEEEATALGVWNSFNDTVKWGRLYGGAIDVALIKGQDLSTPLRIETIGKGQFKGMYSLDRWMVEPSLGDLVTDFGPTLGLPKYYNVTMDAAALSGKKIHHSRVMRMEGIGLPYQQRLAENLWSVSVIERLYDRMLAFDSTTQGAAQLVYKSYIRTYKIKGLRQIISTGGPAYTALLKFVNLMRQTQSIEGLTLLDGEDEFEALTHGAFSGLSDILSQFAEQLAGALQIPLVRLFGQSPKGFSTGETDLRMYYDSIHQQQNRHMLVPVTNVYRCIAQSLGIKVPDGFSLQFKPLWQITEKEKAEIVTATTGAVMAAQGPGLISDRTALMELKQASDITGMFTNISQDDIEAANDVPTPPVDPLMPGAEGGAEGSEGGGDTPPKPKPKKKTDDCSYEKLTQIEAGYVPISTKPTHCGICKRFLAPADCLIVAGPIAFAGGCHFFLAKDAA